MIDKKLKKNISIIDKIIENEKKLIKKKTSLKNFIVRGKPEKIIIEKIIKIENILDIFNKFFIWKIKTDKKFFSIKEIKKKNNITTNEWEIRKNIA